MANDWDDTELDARLEAFEVQAKRFGTYKADLGVKTLNSGFTAFNRFKLLRQSRPDLCVIGARPGNGKTSFLVQVLRSVARSGAGHTMMFSLEMAGSQLMERALAAEAETAIDDLYRLPESRRAAAEERIGKEDFFVDDSSGTDINTLRARVLDYKRRYPLAAVGVDYLQIVGADGASPRERVGQVAHGLKQLAKDINAPVIALAQMSREIEKRQAQSKTARPVMSDLQECSLVENWADQILFLDGAGKRDPSRLGQIDCTVSKNRHGQTGEFVLAFDGSRTQFSDFEDTGL
jgi:replicative DNA helicase